MKYLRWDPSKKNLGHLSFLDIVVALVSTSEVFTPMEKAHPIGTPRRLME
jgi:hypothetical protein